MTTEEMNNLAQIADKKGIIAELKGLGYINCEKHREYQHIGLVDLFEGVLTETEEFPDAKNKRRYQVAKITGVKNYEKLEFIIVNINDNQHKFPIEMLIWAQET